MQLIIYVVFLFATAMCNNNESLSSEIKSEGFSHQQSSFSLIYLGMKSRIKIKYPEELITVLDPNSGEKGLNQEPSTDVHNVRHPQNSAESKNEVPKNLNDPPTERIKGATGSSAYSPDKDSEKKLENTLETDKNSVPAEKDNVNQSEPISDQTKNEADMENTPQKWETSEATSEFNCSSMWPECTDPHNATEHAPAQLSRFTLDVYKTLAQHDETSNLVIAPISIALGLSQLMLGSSGKTRELMLKTLYRDMENPQCVHHAIQNLTNFKSFISANEIFFNKDFSLRETFSSQSERFYGSKGIQLQKDKKKNLDRINKWVSKATNNLIPSVFKELPDFELMLISVIYYQGKWLNQFDPKLTKKENFKTPSSGSVRVSMMNHHKYPLQSLRDAHLQAQVARLPLSDNYSFIIFLPLSQEKEGLKNVESQLTEEILNLLITQLEEKSPRATTISIPKLKLDSEFGLTETLRLLGLYDLFENPEFCALSDSSELVLSDVRHRAVLEIKESGVKAAAATSVTVARTMPVFSVHRPFLYVLVNDMNKIPIVIGRVTDPSK